MEAVFSIAGCGANCPPPQPINVDEVIEGLKKIEAEINTTLQGCTPVDIATSRIKISKFKRATELFALLGGQPREGDAKLIAQAEKSLQNAQDWLTLLEKVRSYTQRAKGLKAQGKEVVPLELVLSRHQAPNA